MTWTYTISGDVINAFAVLRAYATGRTADDCASDLVTRRLQPEQLREDAGSDH